MKGIYLSPGGKKEIEDKIAELKKPMPNHDGIYVSDWQHGQIEALEEILISATILPVEETAKSQHELINRQVFKPEGFKGEIIVEGKNITITF